MAKVVFVYMHGGIDRASMLNLWSKMMDADGAKVKQLGGRSNLKMSDAIRAEWDKVKDQYLANFMEKSFMA